MSEETRRYWAKAAATLDNDLDHGLREPVVRVAWTHLLKTWLPTPPAHILDAGCGTGSLSVVMAGLGYTVTGIDFSPEMLVLAKAKAAAAGHTIPFQVMDAAAPQFPPHSFDSIVCRHLLWALPEPAEVLRRWVKLLKPGGRLVLIEGFWETGSGLHADEVAAALPASCTEVSRQNLSDQLDYWGRPVSDERYIVVAITAA